MVIGLVCYALILLGLFFSSMKYSSTAVTAVFLMFSLEQWGQISSSFLIIYSSFTNICVGVIVALAFVKSFFLNRHVFKNIPLIIISVLCLYVYAFFSLQWSPAYEVGTQQWKHYLPYLAITVVIAPLLINDEKDIQKINNAFQFFGFPLLILLLFFAEWENRRLVIVAGPEPSLGNPLEIGTFSAMLFTVAVFNNITWLGKVGLPTKFLLIILSSALIVVSGSRGQLLSVILAVYVLWTFRYKVSNPVNFIFAGVSILAVTFLIFTAINYLGEGNIRWDLERISFDIAERYAGSTEVLSYWSDSIFSMLLGLGNSASYDLLGIYPHNVPAEIIAEEGLIGFFIYSIIFIKTIHASIYILRNTKVKTEKRNAGVTLIAFFLITFVLSLKQGSFLSNMYFFMFVLMVNKYSLYVKRGIYKNVRSVAYSTN